MPLTNFHYSNFIKKRLRHRWFPVADFANLTDSWTLNSECFYYTTRKQNILNMSMLSNLADFLDNPGC